MSTDQRNARFLKTLARVADRLDSFAGLFKPTGETKLIAQIQNDAAELRNYAMIKPYGKTYKPSKS